MKDPFGDEHFGCWFLYAYGSGAYFWTGKTKTWPDHGEAMKELKTHGNENMCKAADKAGYDSIQFITRYDAVNWPCQKKHDKGSFNMNWEIVGVKLKGIYSCGSDGKDKYSQLRAGW